MEILYLTTEHFGNVHIIVPGWIVFLYVATFVIGVLTAVLKDDK